MKIEIQLEPECTEPKVIVVTDKVTDEINALLKRLSAEQSPMLAGFQGEQVTALEPSQLYRVYASGGKVYAEAEGGTGAAPRQLLLRAHLQRRNHQPEKGQRV